MIDKEKSKLFRDTEIRVYWIDRDTGEEMSGELWNITWIDSVMSDDPGNDRVIEAQYYCWDVKGDDGHWYGLPETELYLDPTVKQPN